MTTPTSTFYGQRPAEQIGIQPPGYRAPASLRLGPVTLAVAELERSLAFYQQVIGLTLLERQVASDGQRQASLGTRAGSGVDTHVDAVLLVLHEYPGLRPAPQRSRLGLYHFALLLPTRADFARFLAHTEALGVRVGMADHLFSEASYLTDPDGINLEVYCDRPRQQWQVASSGELLGAVDPLDLASLRALLGGQRWRGVPLGTTMGHLHFYIGDLAGAERFYHLGLGLAKMTWSFRGALFVAAGGYHHHLGLNTWAAAGALVASRDEARLLNWQLILPDAPAVTAAATSLRQAGYASAPAPAAGAGLMANDPWGIAVNLLAEPSPQP
jgi:catechol 2,3-dioxygenase